MMKRTEKRLTKGTIFGYGLAGIGNNVAASLFYVYFIFFLTTVAGVSPSVAGAISLIAVLWDGINDPMIGYWSDNCKSKFGRRRPFQISGLVPMCIVITLMFTNVPFSSAGKSAFYIIINILFWFLFTWVDVPTIALGDSLEGSYDEKTKARTAWTVCVMIGGLLATDLPPVMVDFFEAQGTSVDRAWLYIGLIGAVITFAAYFISWNATRGKEIIPKQVEAGESSGRKPGFLQQYAAAFRNRPMRYAMFGILFIYLGFNGAALPTMNYILAFNLQLDGATSTIYLLVYSLASIAGSYILGAISSRGGEKLGGKAKECGMPFLIYGVLSILGIVVGSNKVVVLLLFFTLGFCSSAFFLHGWNLAIDAAKIEQYKTGEDHSCEYTAFIGFAFKIGGAIGMYLVGMLLGLFGFNGELATQSASALLGIEITFYVVSGVFVVIGALILFKSPLTRRKLDAILDAIQKKEQGEPVSEEAFADLL